MTTPAYYVAGPTTALRAYQDRINRLLQRIAQDSTGDCPSCGVGTLQHHMDRGECVDSCCPECHWIASRDESPIPAYLMEETR